MTARTTIQLRRGTAAQWTSANPTLAAGEVGVETDTGKSKVGDGSTAWPSLPYGVLSTDSRLTDSRTPTAHATSHKSGGSDAIKLNELAAPTAAVALNSQKITGMANGAASGDGATYDQTPASILTTQGDLLYASAANTPARLGIGTAYQVLRTNSGATAPEWVSGGIQLITETDLSGSAANFDFTSIPSTYRHLRLVVLLRSDRAGTDTDTCNLTLNNDSTDANYLQMTMSVTNSGTQSDAASNSRVLFYVTAATATAGAFGTYVVDVMHYTSAQWKSVFAGGSRASTSTSNIGVAQAQIWKSTAAVNRITISPVVGSNFISGSRVSLYGIG